MPDTTHHAPAFREITRERYDDAFNVLPPAEMGLGFLVTEPWGDRECRITGHVRATYQGYVSLAGRYYETVEPLTAPEFRRVTAAQVLDTPVSTLDAARLIAILEAAGEAPHAHSGPGMSGRHCVAFTPDQDAHEVHVLADVLAEARDGQEYDALLHGVRISGTGRGRVFHWPAVAWPEMSAAEGAA